MRGERQRNLHRNLHPHRSPKLHHLRGRYQELKLNQPQASDGWLTYEDLWLVSKTVSDKLRAHLLSQGFEGVPENNTAVFTVLRGARASTMERNMHLKTFRVGGVPFVVSPYNHGMHIREGVFHRQLFVSCSGDIEYPEDIPAYGTYWIGTTLSLGRCGLIEDAMALARSHVAADDFDLSGSPGAFSFRAELIQIHDESKRLVLTGRVSCRTVDWCEPVSSSAEVIEVRRKIDELQSEIHEEMRADNFSTMRYLRKEISALEGRFVDTSWRNHAKVAIADISG